jgi:hypothetical protein
MDIQGLRVCSPKPLDSISAECEMEDVWCLQEGAAYYPASRSKETFAPADEV